MKEFGSFIFGDTKVLTKLMHGEIVSICWMKHSMINGWTMTTVS